MPCVSATYWPFILTLHCQHNFSSYTPSTCLSRCYLGLCPAGFDPVGLDDIPARRTIRLELGHMGGIMMGKYAFGFAGSEVYLPANSNDNDEAKCTSALSKLKSVEKVSCKRETFNTNTGTASYLISMLSYPEKPYMNNLVHHNGNPGINLFSCNVSKIDHEEASEPFCFVSNADTTTTFPCKCVYCALL